jgi:hypothetical protein
MNDQRYAERLPTTTGQFRSVSRGAWWHLIAHYMTEADSAFLNDVTSLQHPGTPTTAFVTLPAFFGETGAAVLDFKCLTDTILKVQ